MYNGILNFVQFFVRTVKQIQGQFLEMSLFQPKRLYSHYIMLTRQTVQKRKPYFIEQFEFVIILKKTKVLNYWVKYKTHTICVKFNLYFTFFSVWLQLQRVRHLAPNLLFGQMVHGFPSIDIEPSVHSKKRMYKYC